MFDVNYCRQQFPALLERPKAIFLDGPGGTQVPRRVIEAISHYLTRCNANHGGVFATSQESDAILHHAHEVVADFLNAPSAEEVVFGANMTTLTLGFTRSIAKTLKPGDEVVVTRLDHDGNVSPWLLAARDAGATVRWVDIIERDCTLDLDSLRKSLNPKTRWVAVGCASNAAGTINDVTTIAKWAHEVGAKVFLDAVHYGPHGPIDVQAWGCDALGCSAYKFFGPHVGIMWAKRELLEELPVYKLRPASNALPDRWMTGTQNHECIAGVAAAVEYLHDLGQKCSEVGVKDNGHKQNSASARPATLSRRSTLRTVMTEIQKYETALGRQLLEGLAKLKRFKVWGITDLNNLASRVPTVSITHESKSPEVLARHLAARDMFAWNGNMYAINLSERLGLEDKGGFLRLGLVHYNTKEEIERVLAVLAEVS